jgi:hypothetical protein
MSADNSVIVANFKDGFRIGYGGAADNLQYMPDYHGYNREYLNYWFGKSEVYLTKTSALKAAHKLCNSIGFVEYGVSMITIDAPFQE